MKVHLRSQSLAFAVAILCSVIAGAQSAKAQTTQERYTPPPANLKARTWFQDAKFGMVIHWGVYSVLGDGEWIMETRPINGQHYTKVSALVNPIKFDPAALGA